MKRIIVNAQWQGGMDLTTFDGAQEIVKLYLTGLDFLALPVLTDSAEIMEKKNGIIGFDILRMQMTAAYERLLKEAPDKIFALGGGCDADVPVIVYLCERYQGDLTVIWLDAHGDLNTPEESVSSLYYGMPLRSVMDEHCFGLLENRFPLKPSQIVHIGGRDLDDGEKVFMEKSGMRKYTVQDLRSDRKLIHKMAADIQSKHLYIHLDLDVLDPEDFSNTPLPVPGGLNYEEVYDIVDAVSDKLEGIGMYEYAPAGKKNAFIEKLILQGTFL